MDDRDQELQQLRKIATFLLAVCGILFTGTFLLSATVLWLKLRDVRLNDLSQDDRRRLVDQAETIIPMIYQEYPLLDRPGFYRMKPNTSYDLFGSSFITNDIGFRSLPTNPKPDGIMRIVVVGDSWTFGQGVKFEEVFSQHLQTLLNHDRDRWEVINLSMPGWNTQNELAAIHVLLPKLRPDMVIICPTSNDIDDSYGIRNGRLVNRGFRSGSIFQHSYEYESRWVEAFLRLQEAADFLRYNDIPVLLYFLAEWRQLAPYYAKLSGLTASYIVVPTAYIVAPYRLPTEVDPAQHGTPEGHYLIAAYLYNALLKLNVINGSEPISLNYEVAFPGQSFMMKDVRREFTSWGIDRPIIDLMRGRDDDYIGKEAILKVPAEPGARRVSIHLELLDELGLYPLLVRIQIASPDKIEEAKRFQRYFPGVHTMTLSIPSSVKAFDYIDIRIGTNHAVSVSERVSPISMKWPKITFD